MWNVRKCGFDGGDCKEFNEFMQDHPDCLVEDEDQYTYRIGDNICDVKCNAMFSHARGTKEIVRNLIHNTPAAPLRLLHGLETGNATVCTILYSRMCS